MGVTPMQKKKKNNWAGSGLSRKEFACGEDWVDLQMIPVGRELGGKSFKEFPFSRGVLVDEGCVCVEPEVKCLKAGLGSELSIPIFCMDTSFPSSHSI